MLGAELSHSGSAADEDVTQVSQQRLHSDLASIQEAIRMLDLSERFQETAPAVAAQYLRGAKEILDEMLAGPSL